MVSRLAYQSLYYLEPSETNSPQLLVKRWIDIAMASDRKSVV